MSKSTGCRNDPSGSGDDFNFGSDPNSCSDFNFNSDSISGSDDDAVTMGRQCSWHH